MDGIPMVRAAAYWPIVPAMSGIGLPVQRHLDAVWVPDEAMDQPDLLLPERPVWELFQRARELDGVDDIGFRVGASHGVMDVPGLARPLAGKQTLLQLMKAFCNELRGHSNCWTYWISQVGDGVLFCRRGSPIDVGRWPIEQYAIGYLTDLVRMSAPADWFSGEIWLQAQPGELRCERNWLGDARLHFGHPFTAIHVPNALLGRPVHYRKLSGKALHMQPIAIDFVANLRQIVGAYAGLGGFGLEGLAELVGLHPRTLQRQLARQGTSYREVLASARFERARELLAATDVKVSDVATDLGYGSVAAFGKEFRKWAGLSPRRYRSTLKT